MKRLLYLLSVAALIWSCDKVDEIDLPILDEPIVEEEKVPASTLPEVLYAYSSGDEEDSQTRTFIDAEKMEILWNDGDNIFYCAGNIIGAEYKYDGEDGAARATFKKDGNGNSSEVAATFPVGVFPYKDNFGAKFNSNNIEDEADDTWTITPEFEMYQNYVPNSFDKDANIMIAAGKGEDNNLFFRNACGYVVIKLYGTNVTVNEVQFFANYKSEQSIPRIWGKLYDIKVDSDGKLTYQTNNLNYEPWQQMVSLNCIDSKTGQGVRISEDPNNPTEFWFALPPIILEDGIRIKVLDSNNKQVLFKESTKSFEIERNKIKRMAALDASDPNRTRRLWYNTPKTGDSSQPIAKFNNQDEWLTGKYFDANIIGHHWDRNNTPTGERMYYIEFDRPLTEIKAGAFEGTGVTEIFIPESLTTIGDDAFADNTGLTTLTLPGRVTRVGQNAFANCTALESVTIEPSATNAQMTIGVGAFQNTGLTSLTIPSRVVGIEQEAFADCAKLRPVTFESGSTPLTIGSTDQSVNGDHPFYDSNNITSLRLNRELVKAHNDVSMNLFKNHTNLVSVELGDNVQTIYGEMFYNTAIAQLTIPGNVTCIKENAFSNCQSLTYVKFLKNNSGTPLTIDTPNESYYSNGNYNLFRGSNNIHTLYLYREFEAADEKEYMGLFENHTALTNITIDEQVETIHYHMFYNAGGKDGNSIDKITIPSSVKSIESGAFRECKVSEILINGSSEATPRIINGSAFEGCTLTSITIPEGVTTIGACAFINCSNLTAITIPGTVTEIGERAFKGCTSLKNVRFNPGAEQLTIDNMDEVVIEGVSKPDRGPFYHSPLTSIYLDRDIKMTDTYAGELDAADEGIFSCVDYDENYLTTTLTIGENVTKILPYMFASSAITSITIPANVTEIGYNAFQECTKLSTVEIKDSSTPLYFGYQVTGIFESEWGPFYDSPLAKVTLKRDINYVMDANNKPFTPDEWDEGVFANEHDVLTTINLNANLTKILPYMFSRTEAANVWIPHTVTSIGDKAFSECKNLLGVTMGYDGTTEFPSIGTYVFESCEKFYYIKVRKSQLKKFQDSTQWDTYEEMLKNGFTTGDDLP